MKQKKQQVYEIGIKNIQFEIKKPKHKYKKPKPKTLYPIFTTYKDNAEKVYNKRPCKKCDKMFRPTGRYSRLCANCISLSKLNRKRR